MTLNPCSRAYWTAVTAADTVRVVEQSLARIDAHLEDLRVRLETGLIPPNEVLTAEAQRARQEVQVIEQGLAGTGRRRRATCCRRWATM